MRQVILAFTATVMPVALMAQGDVAERIVQDHIQPRFERLADTAETFARVASRDCTFTSKSLRTAYSDAFDAWISASHLRFGPTEIDDRAFAIAFWPDSRGTTPKVLNKLITDQDPIGFDADAFADVSIAGRGFYAMEFLLFDEVLNTAGDDEYRCTLIQTIAADTASLTRAIADDWQNEYADHMLNPSTNGTYRSDDEVMQEFLKALSTGLQFTAETRLGRPLGAVDRPRPTRADAWRSGRSARHVALSLRALQEMAADLTGGNAPLASDLRAAFEQALKQLAVLDDPVFAGVSAPSARIKVEVIQQSVQTIRTIVRNRLGPELGVAAGFNSLDGD